MTRSNRSFAVLSVVSSTNCERTPALGLLRSVTASSGEATSETGTSTPRRSPLATLGRMPRSVPSAGNGERLDTDFWFQRHMS